MYKNGILTIELDNNDRLALELILDKEIDYRKEQLMKYTDEELIENTKKYIERMKAVRKKI